MQFRPVALIVIAASAVAAQAPTFERNTPVRVDLMDRSRLSGILTSQTADTVFLWTSASRSNQPYAWNSVARISINTGWSPAAGARKGLKRGAIIGGIAYGAWGLFAAGAAIANGERVTNFGPIVALATAVGAISGALYGVIIGAVVGAQEWRTVYPNPGAASAEVQLRRP